MEIYQTSIWTIFVGLLRAVVCQSQSLRSPLCQSLGLNITSGQEVMNGDFRNIKHHMVPSTIYNIPAHVSSYSNWFEFVGCVYVENAKIGSIRKPLEDSVDMVKDCSDFCRSKTFSLVNNECACDTEVESVRDESSFCFGHICDDSASSICANTSITGNKTCVCIYHVSEPYGYEEGIGNCMEATLEIGSNPLFGRWARRSYSSRSCFEINNYLCYPHMWHMGNWDSWLGSQLYCSTHHMIPWGNDYNSIAWRKQHIKSDVSVWTNIFRRSILTWGYSKDPNSTCITVSKNKDDDIMLEQINCSQIKNTTDELCYFEFIIETSIPVQHIYIETTQPSNITSLAVDVIIYNFKISIIVAVTVVTIILSIGIIVFCLYRYNIIFKNGNSVYESPLPKSNETEPIYDTIPDQHQTLPTIVLQTESRYSDVYENTRI